VNSKARADHPDLVAAIAGVSDAGAAAAQSYGTRCGAAFRLFPSIERFREWANGPSPSASSVLLFLPESQFTVRTTRIFIQLSLAGRISLGLCPTSDAFDVNAFVGLNLQRRTAKWPLLAYSELSVESDTGLAHAAVLGPADSDTFIELSREGASAIVICSHGNAADFKLGASVGCVAMSSIKPRAGGALVCQHGGACLRERLKPVHFVGPQDLNSPLIVLLSCTSTPPSDAILPWGNSFAARLLEAGHTKAVVGSFMLHQERAEWTGELSDLLARGASAGDVARYLNDDAVSGPSFLCMGNPAVRIPRVSPVWLHLSTRTTPLPENEAIDEPAAPVTSTAGRVLAHRALQAQLVSELYADEPRPVLRAATEQLHGRLISNQADDEDLDRSLCEFLAAFVAEGVFLHKYWLGGFELGFARRASEPHVCGGRLFRQAARSGDLPQASRTLWWCERCGTVGDTPAATPLPRFRAMANGFELKCSGVGRDAWLAFAVEAIGNHVLPPSPAQRLSSALTAGRDFARVGFDWPGLQWQTAVLVDAGQFLVVRAPVLRAA